MFNSLKRVVGVVAVLWTMAGFGLYDPSWLTSSGRAEIEDSVEESLQQMAIMNRAQSLVTLSIPSHVQVEVGRSASTTLAISSSGDSSFTWSEAHL
jgi:hypothetical protein